MTHLLLLLLLAVGSASEAATDEITFDFESDGLSGWEIRPGDERYLRASIDSDRPLADSSSLRIDAAGWDTTGGDLEMVEIRHSISPPLRIDSTTVVSWKWWVADTDYNDGVAIDLALHASPDPGAPFVALTTWASHSRRMRSPHLMERTDPERQTVTRLERIAERLAHPDQKRFTWPIYLSSITLSAWFPIDQTARIDEIRIGPPIPGMMDSIEAKESPVGALPRAVGILAADIDGDGRVDWLSTHADDPPTLWMGRARSRSLQVPVVGLGLDSAFLSAPVAGDLDRDGRIDIAGITADRIRVLRGIGCGRFEEIPAPKVDPLLRHAPFRIEIADILPEPGPELLMHRVATIYCDSIFHLSESGRSWTAGQIPDPWGAQFRGSYRGGSAAGDLDGDGRPDLFACNSDLYLQTDSGLVRVTERWLPELGLRQSGAALGDIDNDGDLDLFVSVDIRKGEAARTTHRHCLLYRNDGDRFTDVSARLQGGASRHAKSPLFADFDLDGDLDLFMTQDPWWLPISPNNPAENVYLENDGSGRFRRAHPGLWICETAVAMEAICFDEDDDGDSDLLLRLWDDGQVKVYHNPSRTGRSIKVRVLDRRGAPHAGGAGVTLRDMDGRIAGYRQTGVTPARGEPGEFIFGCPGSGQLELRVEFPPRPGGAIVRRAAAPGRRIVIVEPAWNGPGGAAASAALAWWRLTIEKAALFHSLLLVPLAALFGIVTGGVLFAYRRPFRRKASPDAGGIRPRARRIALGALLLCAAVVASAAPFWPVAAEATRAAWAASGAWGSGMVLGGILCYLDSSRRRAIRFAPGPDGARLALVEAIGGFSHARWLAYLGGIATLSKSLGEGADASAVVPRLQARLAAFEELALPQITEIRRILPLAGLDPTLAATFETDSLRIIEGIRLLRSSSDLMAHSNLAALADAAARMHTTVEGVFHALGPHIRTDAGAALRSALQRAREENEAVAISATIPPGLPPLFVPPGDLANILDNLLTNAARAARSLAAQREPEVRVECRVEGGRMIILVRDSGPGIPQENREAVFTARGVGPGAHGQGLAHARRRLQQLDGKIEILDSGADGGTTISVSLRAIGRPGARLQTGGGL